MFDRGVTVLCYEKMETFVAFANILHHNFLIKPLFFAIRMDVEVKQ